MSCIYSSQRCCLMGMGGAQSKYNTSAGLTVLWRGRNSYLIR